MALKRIPVFNKRKYPVRKVLIGFSQPIYDDSQEFCRVNNIRFTTLVNESVRFYIRRVKESQLLLL